MARPQTHAQKPFSNSAAAKTETPVHDDAIRERISRRAYEIFQARGGVNGDETQDWLQAERELKLGRH